MSVAAAFQVKDSTLKKMKALEDAKEAAEADAGTLKMHVASLERDVEAAKKEAESERKKLEELHHEREILNKLRSQVGGLWVA